MVGMVFLVQSWEWAHGTMTFLVMCDFSWAVVELLENLIWNSYWFVLAWEDKCAGGELKMVEVKLICWIDAIHLNACLRKLSCNVNLMWKFNNWKLFVGSTIIGLTIWCFQITWSSVNLMLCCMQCPF